MKIHIPIKEKSTRVPNKNFRDFHGVPLYQHTLNKLKDYDVYIDTDCDELFHKLSGHKNITIYKRKKELIPPEITVNQIIEDFLNEYVFDNDEIIVHMYVTSPFLKTSTIKKAIKRMVDEKLSGIMGAVEVNQRFWKKDNLCWMPLNHDPKNLLPTQDLKPLYFDSAFYIFTKKSFMVNKNRVTDNFGFYIIEPPEDLDIDTMIDWDLCYQLGKVIK